jgi:hypothetical protein
MNKQTLGALVTLNVALLAALAVTLLLPPTASGQAGRGRGEYVMISGEVGGRQSQQVVYLIETKSQKMAAVFFNSADKSLTVIDTRDLAKDIAAASGGR